ncbi:MAG: hypothetical protein EHM15_07940 [Desulfobacteraceae bacterium]|nr:MAG: hypothetical protein EHM15_07940 [Desulfobacteraceae bacterium]
MNAMNGLVGVGCFAGEATLARVLRRMIDSYCLGAAAFRDQEGASAGGRMLGQLLSGAAGADGERIAGFFLHFKDCRLDLSVFTRRAGGRCEKFTADMREVARLRRQRLN